MSWRPPVFTTFVVISFMRSRNILMLLNEYNKWLIIRLKCQQKIITLWQECMRPEVVLHPSQSQSRVFNQSVGDSRKFNSEEHHHRIGRLGYTCYQKTEKDCENLFRQAYELDRKTFGDDTANALENLTHTH
eukprot:TRINITY_DN4914_c0_g4_i1.p3 TRINITY_DN4914_c0_g4~~TRINITY_DN4914_c0_g4_i1.p3  ORF type:complete len:132 (+),score=5.35 TRINITY_DN4914_c0_g4_i1:1168-1563(+)